MFIDFDSVTVHELAFSRNGAVLIGDGNDLMSPEIMENLFSGLDAEFRRHAFVKTEDVVDENENAPEETAHEEVILAPANHFWALPAVYPSLEEEIAEENLVGFVDGKPVYEVKKPAPAPKPEVRDSFDDYGWEDSWSALGDDSDDYTLDRSARLRQLAEDEEEALRHADALYERDAFGDDFPEYNREDAESDPFEILAADIRPKTRQRVEENPRHVSDKNLQRHDRSHGRFRRQMKRVIRRGWHFQSEDAITFNHRHRGACVSWKFASRRPHQYR